ncbi:MAG: hypothetical protein QXX25_08985 [Thermofilaceae archaeon]
MKAQSEAVGALILAFMILFMLVGANIILRHQAQIIRYNVKLADVVARRQAESISFDCRDDKVYALPSTEMDVLAVVVYNDTSIVYVNTTRMRLSVNQWTALITDPQLASNVCGLKYVLGVVTSTGNLIPWTPPVVVSISRTTLVEQAGFVGPARAYSYNDSTVLPVAYGIGAENDRYPSAIVRRRVFDPGAVHPVIIVFHGGGSLNVTESYRALQLSSSSSAEVNITVSNMYGYFTVSYNYTVSHGMYGSRRYYPYYRAISQSLRIANESSGLSTYKRVIVYVNSTWMTTWMYALGDSTVLPLVVYARGGSVQENGECRANIVVLNPVTGENVTLSVPLFNVDTNNMVVRSVYYPEIIITAVDPDTLIASSFKFTVAPVTVISYISTAGYVALGSAPVTLYYSSNDDEAVATVNAPWSINVDDPWVISWCRATNGSDVPCYYSRWSVAVAVFGNMTVPVAMWQYFRADMTTPGPIAAPTPTPTPVRPPSSPPPVLYAVVDPYPQSAEPTTVSVYVISSRYSPGISATYRIVNEETGEVESSGQLRFGYRLTALGLSYASDPVVLGGDAKRRVEIAVYYGDRLVAVYTAYNYLREK